MYVLMMNSIDDCAMYATFCDVFETRGEAHAEMVERMERHRDDWAMEYRRDPSSIRMLVDDETGGLADGGLFDGSYHESYFIFDTEDPGQTFEW